MSLKLKLFGGIGLCVLFLFLAFSIYAANHTIQIVEQKELETYKLLRDTIQTEMNSQMEVAKLSALIVSNNKQIQQLFAERNREELLLVMLPSFQAIEDKVTHFQFHLPDSTSFLRIHQPEEYGDSLEEFRHTVNECNRTLTMAAGLEEGKAGYGFRVVLPMFYKGRHIGSVEAATDFGASFLHHIAQHFNGDYYIYRWPDSQSVAWEEFQGISGELLASKAENSDQWPVDEETLKELKQGISVFKNSPDQKFGLVLIPFRDYSGEVKGYFKVALDRGPLMAGIFRMKQTMYTYSILGALIVGTIVFIYLSFSLAPIKNLVNAMETITSGDLTSNVEVKSRDEIGQLAQSFQLMVARLREIVSALEEAQEKQAGHLRDTVLALAAAVEARDVYTINHSQQVASIAKTIGSYMGMDKEKVEQIYFAGLLHDIGKIGVPDYILQKPDDLTELEFSEIKCHPDAGYHILEAAGDLYSPMAPLVRHHHERWDGGGYPAGLKGEEIPLGAAILAVADAFDAMVSSRPYRNALTETEALAEIEAGNGRQFHPTVVEAFVHNYQEIMKEPSFTSIYRTPEGEHFKGVDQEKYSHMMSLRPFDYRVRYDGILQAVQDVVLVFCQDLKVIDWNHKAEQLYGYTCQELKGMPAENLFSASDPKEVENLLQQALEQSGKFKTWHCKKDGTVFPVEISICTFVESGKKCWLNLVRKFTIH